MAKWLINWAPLVISGLLSVAALSSFRRSGRARAVLLRENRELERALSASRAAADEWKRQLEHADRMAFLGVAAAHVAHEINNPLLFVTLNLPRVRQLLPDAGKPFAEAARAELVDALGDAEEGVSRIQTIAQDLKTYSRRHEGEPELVDLRDAVRASLSMIGRLFPAQARFEEEQGAVPLVCASRVRVVQVLVNLLRNALEALPAGRAGNVVRVTTGTSAAGDARVVVEDNGPGISLELLPRIFEPFFTTKPAQVGTGLGLPICREIVQSLGGQLRVESRPGHGARFEVSLPAAQSVRLARAGESS